MGSSIPIPIPAFVTFRTPPSHLFANTSIGKSTKNQFNPKDNEFVPPPYGAKAAPTSTSSANKQELNLRRAFDDSPPTKRQKTEVDDSPSTKSQQTESDDSTISTFDDSSISTRSQQTKVDNFSTSTKRQKTEVDESPPAKSQNSEDGDSGESKGMQAAGMEGVPGVVQGAMASALVTSTTLQVVSGMATQIAQVPVQDQNNASQLTTMSTSS